MTLLKEFIKLNVNAGNDKKCETFKTKYSNCKCFLEYTNFKDNLIQ